MESAKESPREKRHDDAARAFGAALRAKPGDKSAERGFGRAIRELEIYDTRELQRETMRKLGMSEAAPAIERGLRWLAGQPQKNGRWSCKPTDATDDMATTAFALLAFPADGNPATVEKGLDWLRARQRADGSFGGVRLYTEGLCDPRARGLAPLRPEGDAQVAVRTPRGA